MFEIDVQKSLVFTASSQQVVGSVPGTKSPSPAYVTAPQAASGNAQLDTTGSSSASTAGGKSTYRNTSTQDGLVSVYVCCFQHGGLSFCIQSKSTFCL